MIIVDTNVLSALMKLEKEPGVCAWLDSQSLEKLRVSAPTVFETHHGISALPAGRRRLEIETRLSEVLADIFNNIVLPFDSTAAESAGRAHAEQIARGRNVEVPDSQIAGIARCLGAAIATRNVDDFSGLGIPLINPWE